MTEKTDVAMDFFVPLLVEPVENQGTVLVRLEHDDQVATLGFSSPDEVVDFCTRLTSAALVIWGENDFLQFYVNNRF